MYKRSINIVLIVLLTYMLSGCGRSHSENDKDSFYTVSRAWSFIRFPLIKPYQGFHMFNYKTWDITLVPQDNIEYIRAGNVIELSVIDSVIYAVCGDSTGFNDTCFVKAAWHIIIPKNKKEKSFLTESDFNQYIKNNKLPSPQWIKPETAWEEFNKEKKLPWIK